MAKTVKKVKKVNKTIEVNKMSIKEISDLLKEKDNATTLKKIVARVTLDRLINGYDDKNIDAATGKPKHIPGLKDFCNELTDDIINTPYDAIKQELQDSNLIGEDEEPIIKIGEDIAVSLASHTSVVFELDKDLKESNAVVPEMYKKHTVSLDKKKLEEAFKDGTLPDPLKPYCSSRTVTITKMTQKKI